MPASKERLRPDLNLFYQNFKVLFYIRYNYNWVAQMCRTKVGTTPPGSAEHEIEQFPHKEIVGMIITKQVCSDRNSMSVCFFSQQPDLGPKRDSTPGATVQTRRIHPLGQISHFYPPGIIMRPRVYTDVCIHTQGARVYVYPKNICVHI